jgi:hypothetical protein
MQPVDHVQDQHNCLCSRHERLEHRSKPSQYQDTIFVRSKTLCGSSLCSRGEGSLLTVRWEMDRCK